jgi:hypothetical protein
VDKFARIVSVIGLGLLAYIAYKLSEMASAL